MSELDATGPYAKLPAGSANEPTPFGKYFLLGMIARGGMAEVFRARLRVAGDRLLAIKCMRPQLAKETRFVEMFIREGKLAVLLEHDAIVRTFEIGKVEGRYYIAMEYIGGKDLTQILRRCQETTQRIPVPHAVHMAQRICEGLHYAHTRTDNEGRPLNIVNRDVSPSNVRISYDGEVKLLDFGIAQALVKFTSEIGVLKGKFSYMSPEQIRGMPLDARTDVFSTGIILHEMLTTEKLFRGDTEFALMEKVRKADVTLPSKFNRRVPEALDRIVLKALARDLHDRYQSAQEFADDLRQFLSTYRFDPAELQEFTRSLFRQDYAKEVEDLEAAMNGGSMEAPTEEGEVPSMEVIIEPSHPGTGEPTSPSALGNNGEEPPLRPSQLAGGQVSTSTGPPPGTPTNPAIPAVRPGLWQRLKGKFGK